MTLLRSDCWRGRLGSLRCQALVFVLGGMTGKGTLTLPARPRLERLGQLQVCEASYNRGSQERAIGPTSCLPPDERSLLAHSSRL